MKHYLLEGYLERLIMKVGTRWKSFTYIDGYAGPWDSVAPDLSDTSFHRAVVTMSACQKKLAEGGRTLPMRAIFCEKGQARSKRLVAYAEEHTSPTLRLEAYRADFTEKVGEITASLKDDEFTFALIDPTGYSQISPAQLAPLLNRRSVEVLINLMWEHIERFWDFHQNEDLLNRIFGADRKEKLTQVGAAALYASALREQAGLQGGRLYASAFPVQNPDKNRVLYYLVYGTHSPAGLLTFDKVAEKTWPEQALAAAEAKVRKRHPSGDLFAGAVTCAKVDRPVDVEKIRQKWLELLGEVGADTTASEAVAADLLEKCDCLEIDLQRVLAQLCNEGRVKNLDAARARPRNTVSWKDQEKLRRLA